MRQVRPVTGAVWFLVVLAASGVAVGLAGCGGKGGGAAGGSYAQREWPADDRSLCEWKGRPDIDVNETAGPGAFRPNVRRVYKITGDRDNRKQALICREADTNLDGIKDVARTFNAKGEPEKERADSNYDGKVDVWISFVNGVLAEMEEDTNFDGKPDVWKNYADGSLTRVRRDRNHDGKADLWEVYVRGKLERVGVDEDGDGAVDRWDRDLTVGEAASGGGSGGGGGAAEGTADGGAAPASAGGADAGAPARGADGGAPEGGTR